MKRMSQRRISLNGISGSGSGTGSGPLLPHAAFLLLELHCASTQSNRWVASLQCCHPFCLGVLYVSTSVHSVKHCCIHCKDQLMPVSRVQSARSVSNSFEMQLIIASRECLQYNTHSGACVAEVADTRVVAFVLPVIYLGTNLLGNQLSHEAACGVCGKSALHSQEYTILSGSCQGGILLSTATCLLTGHSTQCEPKGQMTCITSKLCNILESSIHQAVSHAHERGQQLRVGDSLLGLRGLKAALPVLPSPHVTLSWCQCCALLQPSRSRMTLRHAAETIDLAAQITPAAGSLHGDHAAQSPA